LDKAAVSPCPVAQISGNLGCVLAPHTSPLLPAQATRPLASLSVEEVCGLLHALEFGQYATGLRAHSYNGTMLGVAQETDLEEVPDRPQSRISHFLSPISDHESL